jgi:hypothetical protein
MIFPCKIESSNGYTIEYKPAINDKHFVGTLSITVINAKERDYSYTNKSQVLSLYNALFKALKSISNETKTAATVTLPSSQIAWPPMSYIAVVVNEENNCIITLSSKNMLDEFDTYKNIDIIEIPREQIQLFVRYLSQVLDDLEELDE